MEGCAMRQAIVFVSMCPNCKGQQLQDAFAVEDLVRLLNGGYPLEAYCVPCDEFWPLSVEERIELIEVVGADCKQTPPLNPTPAVGPRQSA
jgi:hypothetical protein